MHAGPHAGHASWPGCALRSVGSHGRGDGQQARQSWSVLMSQECAEPGDGGADVPGWLVGLARSAARMPVPALLRAPAGGGRRSAVLILFGDGPDGPDLLLVQRSPWLRRHAGQPAFPGGAVDKSDAGPVSAALREAAEEAQVNPSGVQVLAVLPELFISRSGFSVTPVLAWWRRPGPVGPGDPMEVTAVARIRVAELADPAESHHDPLPVRGRRPRLPGRRDAGLGIYRHAGGPAARAERLGAALGLRPRRRTAARSAARCGPLMGPGSAEQALYLSPAPAYTVGTCRVTCWT